MPLEPRHASAAKAALCAHVYCLVFDWCVDVINDYVSVHPIPIPNPNPNPNPNPHPNATLIPTLPLPLTLTP